MKSYKLIIVGKAYSGKTSLIHQLRAYGRRQDSDDYCPTRSYGIYPTYFTFKNTERVRHNKVMADQTMGVLNSSAMTDLGKQIRNGETMTDTAHAVRTIRLDIWDIPTMQTYKMRKWCFRDVDALILMKQNDSEIDEIIDGSYLRSLSAANKSIVICTSKCDLDGETDSDLEERVRSEGFMTDRELTSVPTRYLGYYHVQTSAKYRINVALPFVQSIRNLEKNNNIDLVTVSAYPMSELDQ